MADGGALGWLTEVHSSLVWLVYTKNSPDSYVHGGGFDLSSQETSQCQLTGSHWLLIPTWLTNQSEFPVVGSTGCVILIEDATSSADSVFLIQYRFFQLASPSV